MRAFLSGFVITLITAAMLPMKEPSRVASHAGEATSALPKVETATPPATEVSDSIFEPQPVAALTEQASPLAGDAIGAAGQTTMPTQAAFEIYPHPFNSPNGTDVCFCGRHRSDPSHTTPRDIAAKLREQAKTSTRYTQPQSFCAPGMPCYQPSQPANRSPGVQYRYQPARGPIRRFFGR